MPAEHLSLAARTGTGRFAAPVREALDREELFAVWSAACAEANIAYDAWRDEPGPASYAAYRAAQDREDAAQDALAGIAA
jgi:hypothetical protein